MAILAQAVFSLGPRGKGRTSLLVLAEVQGMAEVWRYAAAMGSVWRKRKAGVPGHILAAHAEVLRLLRAELIPHQGGHDAGDLVAMLTALAGGQPVGRSTGGENDVVVADEVPLPCQQHEEPRATSAAGVEAVSTDPLTSANAIRHSAVRYPGPMSAIVPVRQTNFVVVPWQRYVVVQVPAPSVQPSDDDVTPLSQLHSPRFKRSRCFDFMADHDDPLSVHMNNNGVFARECFWPTGACGHSDTEMCFVSDDEESDESVWSTGSLCNRRMAIIRHQRADRVREDARLMRC